MVGTFLVFGFALALVLKGATLATRYAAKLAESFHLSKYTVGFIIVAIISILPEAFISINSALTGIPSFGLSVLFGSNVADLTLIFALIITMAGRSLKIKSRILKQANIYPFFLLLPLALGLDGYYSRFDGAALVAAGAVFYYLTFKKDTSARIISGRDANWYRNLLPLLLGMAMLLIGSHYTVVSATTLAYSIDVSPILIGMLVVGLGTTMPELLFSLKSLKRNQDDLAVGDILGTVLADATVIVGILALIHPFKFPSTVVYVTGIFMVAAALLLSHFMRSGKNISQKESFLLAGFWLVFVLVELAFAN